MSRLVEIRQAIAGLEYEKVVELADAALLGEDLRPLAGYEQIKEFLDHTGDEVPVVSDEVYDELNRVAVSHFNKP